MGPEISELSTLYDVLSLSFPEKYDDLMEEVVEKATRLFGIKRLAVVLREGDKYKCLGRWGFRRDEEALERIKSREEGFVYVMQNGIQGLLYMEPPGRISERDKRLYTIFARRIEWIIAQKQTEEQIRNSEREKKIILDSIMELLVYQDPDHRVLWANRAAAEYAGMPTEKLKGQTCFEVLSHREEPCEECPVAKALQSGLPEMGIVTLQGDRQFLVRAYPVQTEDGFVEGIVEACVDITERVQAERAFSTVFDSVHDAIFLHDLDGKIIDVNRTMLEMYGLKSKEEAVRLSIITDYSSSENPVQRLPEQWKKAMSGESVLFQWKARRPSDGSEFDAEVVLKKISLSHRNVILATVRDITERKREVELLQSLFTCSPTAMYIVRGGKIQLVNPEFERLSGYRQEELMGKKALDLVLPEDRKTVRRNAARMLKGRVSRPYEFRMVTKQGGIRWVQGSVAPFWHAGTRAAVGSMIDITEKKAYEENLKYLSLHDQLTGLYNRAYYEEELERLAAGREYPITIIAADVNDLKFINDSMGHDKGDQLLIACAEVLRKTLRGSDILARVGGDEFVAVLPRTDEKAGESILARLRLSVERYNQEHPELPLSISFGIATASTPQESLKETYKKADDLMYEEKLYLGASARSKIVDTLLSALAERDFVTAGHTKRVQKLCRRLGEKIGLSLQQLVNLSLLAQVHDLGKVGIPDQILFKRGPLTEKEWEVMRQHPEKGYRIALSSPDLAGIADLILKHHEKWDGTGYPLGLKGEDIPIECRVLALADAFDAMTGERPYRRAKTVEEALEEIRRCAGTQFDPVLAEMFIRMIATEGNC